MICECGHVGGSDVAAVNSQHLNGVEACIVPECDCERFDGVVGIGYTVAVVEQPKVAKPSQFNIKLRALVDAQSKLQAAHRELHDSGEHDIADRVHDLAIDVGKKLADHVRSNVVDGQAVAS